MISPFFSWGKVTSNARLGDVFNPEEVGKLSFSVFCFFSFFFSEQQMAVFLHRGLPLRVHFKSAPVHWFSKGLGWSNAMNILSHRPQGSCCGFSYLNGEQLNLRLLKACDAVSDNKQALPKGQLREAVCCNTYGNAADVCIHQPLPGDFCSNNACTFTWQNPHYRPPDCNALCWK